MNTVFSICSLNFVRRAIVLLDSVAKTTPGIKTVLFIVDRADEETLKKLKTVQQHHSIVFADKLNIINYSEMCFKYSIVEMNTAIKPNAFAYLFQNGSDKALYLDPDIFVLDNLNNVFSLLDSHSAIVTPHIISDSPASPGTQPLLDFLWGGIMNLGFIAISNDLFGKKIISWWEDKLFDGAFEDKFLSTAYDQKWVDFFPALFGNRIFIERNPGYNVASWNIHERKLLCENGCFSISYETKSYPLVFYHFSGYKIGSNALNSRIPDFKIIEGTPLHALVASYLSLIEKIPEPELDKATYAFSVFSNQVIILPIHRRLFRQLREKINSDPFDAEGRLYTCFKACRMIGNSNYIEEIRKFTKTPAKQRSESIFKWFMLFIYHLFGYKKYLMLLEAFYKYSRIEHNTFLIESRLEKYSNRQLVSDKKQRLH